MGRDALIERLHRILDESNEVGPEHEAFYELYDGIIRFIAELKNSS